MDLLLDNKNQKKTVLFNCFSKHPLNNNLKVVSINLNLSIISTKLIISDLNNYLATHFPEVINMNTISTSLTNSNYHYSSIVLHKCSTLFNLWY